MPRERREGPNESRIGVFARSVMSRSGKWLKRPHSAVGPGCLIAVSKVVTDWTSEIPDAIGFSLLH